MGVWLRVSVRVSRTRAVCPSFRGPAPPSRGLRESSTASPSATTRSVAASPAAAGRAPASASAARSGRKLCSPCLMVDGSIGRREEGAGRRRVLPPGSPAGLLHPQETPDASVEIEGVMGTEQVVADDRESAAGAVADQGVEVAGRSDPHVRPFPHGEGVAPDAGRILDVRLPVPDVAVEVEDQVAGVAAGLEHPEADGWV